MTTRREVLKYAGLGVGAAAASALGCAGKRQSEANDAQPPAKPAQTEVTDKSGKRLAAGRGNCMDEGCEKRSPQRTSR